jgi:putative DNA primase/helicase
MPKKDDSKVVPIKSGVDPALAELLDVRDSIGLRLNDKRKPIGCLENVVTILLKAPEWQGVLAYNEFALAMEKKKPPPFAQPAAGEWSDADDDELDLWLSQRYDLRAGNMICARAAGIVARRHAYHPVREYLEGLVWDGVPRLKSWLQVYLGATVPVGDQRGTPDYYEKAGRWWLISAVARIFRPGCQADHVLLLEGEQGIGKSSALRILFGEWFSDTPLRIGDKDSYGALRGVWGYELAELDSLNKAESSASKAFFSSIEDKYRPPYGHRDIRARRQVVFAGTVNHDEYLRDSTGNRRYWPVRCSELRLRGIDSLESVRDQLFAEAVVCFKAGDVWYPVESDDRQLFSAQQAEREIGDVYEDLIRVGTLAVNEISMSSIFADILKTEPAKMTRAEQTRVGEAMRQLGWIKKRVGNRYNRSYVYVRKDLDPAQAVESTDNVPF